MDQKPSSSSLKPEPDEAGLAVLVACHHRGPLTPGELLELLNPTAPLDEALTPLSAAGLIQAVGSRYAVTQAGRDYLDRVLEEIEGQLTPDAPEYVRRYRRQDATLPFDANTIWAEAVCVNLRVEPAALRPLIPEVFDLDLYRDSAFVSLTASRLKGFGLVGLPQPLRMNFYQATYRAHVTYTDFRGRRMRGCYFVQSATNSQVMSLTSNLLPEFRAHHCQTYPMVMARTGDHWVLTVDSGTDPSGKVVLVLNTAQPLGAMPSSSMFPSIEEAYTYIVDFRDAFSYDRQTNEVFLLQIDRGDWHIQVVQPVDYYLGYMSEGPFPSGAAMLDSVFYFTDTPYRWLPLVKERIKQG